MRNAGKRPNDTMVYDGILWGKCNRNRPTETSWEIGIRIACDVVVLVCFSIKSLSLLRLWLLMSSFSLWSST